MKKGFTLIELLAVIVILAIIATIATPIVLDIISDTKESAQKRSAEFYLEAVEKSIALSNIKNNKLEARDYNIMSDGNICLGTYEKTGADEKCTDEDEIEGNEILKVEVNGEVPTSGTVTISSGNITAGRLEFKDNKTIIKENGELKYEDKSSDIVFDGKITFFNEGDYYSLDDIIDQTKFKNHTNYKITIDDEKVYNVICTKNNGDTEYSDVFILGDKSSFVYIYDSSEPSEIYSLVAINDGSINLEGEHDVKIEYVNDEVYPHVLRVGKDSLQIFSTKLVEGEAIIEIKDSNDNTISQDVDVVKDSGYMLIEISVYNSNYNIDPVVYYRLLEGGNNIIVTITQGNNTYVLGGENFIYSSEEVEYDCYFSEYYYWGNNNMGYLSGC